ncbi:homeobox protein Hox-B4-like isoform X1 [Mobula birostris]|uniref:homeobox protein Hox-B4-like isoform X1 n=1 Tax=Mobula birostris TaxID=1983395 RepID=UPI003B28A167
MSSFLINSNYVDPKFPPCEEYSQNNYLPSHSPDYYTRAREPGFQHEAMYPRPAYSEQPFSSCSKLQGSGDQAVAPRGHVQSQAGLQNHLAKHGHQCASVAPSPPPSCSQNFGNQSTPCSKEPVVYPWMKKLHINSANLDGSSQRKVVCVQGRFFKNIGRALNFSVTSEDSPSQARLKTGKVFRSGKWKIAKRKNLGSPAYRLRGETEILCLALHLSSAAKVNCQEAIGRKRHVNRGANVIR